MRPIKLQGICLLVLLVCGACAQVQTKPAASPSSECSLWERANAYWQAKIRVQLDKTYPLEEPQFQKRFNLAQYARNYPGEVIYKKATIKSVKIEGKFATVGVAIRYSYFGAFSPKGGARTVVKDYWALVDGQWYHLIKRPPSMTNP